MSDMSDIDYTETFADADHEAQMVNNFLNALSHDIIELAPFSMIYHNPEYRQFTAKSTGRIKSRAAAKKSSV